MTHGMGGGWFQLPSGLKREEGGGAWGKGYASLLNGHFIFSLILFPLPSYQSKGKGGEMWFSEA